MKNLKLNMLMEFGVVFQGICGALCNQDKFLSTVRLPANICRGRVTFHFELFRVSSMFCTLNFETQYNIVHLRFPAFASLPIG